jgi:phage baseplate assembly protein gpV
MYRSPIVKWQMESYVKEELRGLSTMYVGVISAYDPERNRYTVTTVIKPTGADGEELDPLTTIECPASFIKTGSFFIRAGYKLGDMVFVGVNKSSIDEAIISSEIRSDRTNQNTVFSHVNGVILGGIMSDSEPALTTDNANDMILYNRKTGDKIVMLEGGGIIIDTPTSVTVNCDTAEINSTGVTVNTETAEVNASSSVDVTSPTSTFNGDLVVTGTSTLTGAVTASTSVSTPILAAGGLGVDGSTMQVNVPMESQEITASGDVVADGISLMTHTHTNGNDGNPTGPPIP